MLNRLVFVNSLFVIVRVISTSILNALSASFLYKSLGIKEYGLFSLVVSVLAVLSIVNTIMTTTTFQHIGKAFGNLSDKRINEVFNRVLLVHLLLSFFLLLFIFGFGFEILSFLLQDSGDKLYLAFELLKIIGISSIFLIIAIPFTGVLTSLERFGLLSFLDVFKALCLFLLAFNLDVLPSEKIISYALFYSLISIFIVVGTIVYCLVHYPALVRWNFQKKFSDYKNIIIDAGWTSFGTTGWVAQRQGSDLLLARFFGTSYVASISIANQISNITGMVSKSLVSAVVPRILRGSEGIGIDNNNVGLLVLRFTFLLTSIPAVFLLGETEFVLSIWLGSLPPGTVVLSRVLIVISLLEAMSSSLPSLILISRKFKLFMLFGGMISFLTLPGFFILVQLGFGYTWVVYLGLLATIINLLLNLFLLHRFDSLDLKNLFNNVYLPIFHYLLYLIPLFLINIFLESSFFRFYLFFICSVAYSLALSWFTLFTDIEKFSIVNIVKNYLGTKWN